MDDLALIKRRIWFIKLAKAKKKHKEEVKALKKRWKPKLWLTYGKEADGLEPI